MKFRYWILLTSIMILFVYVIKTSSESNKRPNYHIGQPIDSLDGVYVYYNGSMNNVSGRNLTSDNYNLGLKYQCVEFVKRYYYIHLDHKMPNTYGDAKDFFQSSIEDGKINPERDLIQYQNPSRSKPQVGDLVIFDGTSHNKYGHVAIISDVTNHKIEVIQQNTNKTRESFLLLNRKDMWLIKNKRILGWLRKSD